MTVKPAFARELGYLTAGAVLLAIAGCGSALYTQVGKDFADAYGSASDTLKEQSSGAQKTARIEFVERTILAGVPLPGDTEADRFASIACAGAAALYEQRASLGPLKGYAKVIEKLTEDPGKEFADYWRAYSAAREKQKPVKVPGQRNVTRECADEVLGLLKLDAPVGVESVGVLAFASNMDLVSGLVAALDKLFLGAAKLATDAARAQALQEYIQANSGNVKTLLDTLDRKSVYLEGVCRSAQHAKQPYCKRFTELPPGAKLDQPLPDPTVFDSAYFRKKRAAVRVAFHEFQRFERFAIKLGAKGNEARIFRRLDVLDKALGEFDALRVLPYPGTVTDDLRDAQDTLLKVSRGEVSPAEAWGVFKAFIDNLKDFASALKDVKDKTGGSSSSGSDSGDGS